MVGAKTVPGAAGWGEAVERAPHAAVSSRRLFSSQMSLPKL
jgi:hypothetical protein